MSVLRLKACVRLTLNQMLKIFISSDFTFYYLYGDIYFFMVIAKATSIGMILRKTPLKVYSNLKQGSYFIEKKKKRDDSFNQRAILFSKKLF